LSKEKNELPLPVAALRRRAFNAKSPKERHDAAYFAWEASIRLAVAASPPADSAKLVMPSIGHFVSAMNASDERLDTPALLELAGLFEGKSGGKSTTAKKLLAGVPAYRNQIIGHGSLRTAEFYDDAATRLVDALEPAWEAGIFLKPGAALVFIESINVGADGKRLARVVDLTGEAPAVLDPRGTAVDETARPEHVSILANGAVRSVHPWLLYREASLREQVLYFNGRGRSSAYLDYVSGEVLKSAALKEAFPAIETDLDAIFESKPNLDTEPESAKTANQFGDYTVLGKLGEGGMGVVYLARQESLGRVVALKTLSQQMADDATAVARFRRETRALSRCDHPNIVKILASGKRDETHYYAMELVDGADLSQIAGELGATTTLDAAISSAVDKIRLEKEELFAGVPIVKRTAPASLGETSAERIKKLAALFRDAANAIQALHDAKIIHRDLKPANLMVTATDHRLVVMDLGLATASDKESKALTRDASALLGTLRYMPPEQLQRNLIEIDARADVYSLGATFYELMTRTSFLSAETEAQLITQVLHAEPTRPETANRDIPSDLSKIIEKATQKDRRQRYDSAAALGKDLDAFLAGRPISARRPTLVYRARLVARRHKALIAFASIVAVIGIALGANAIRAASRPRDCVFGDAKECAAQCDKGSAASCLTLGDMYGRAIGVPKDPGRMTTLLKKACDGRSGQACYELGAVDETGEAGMPDFDEARRRYGQACDSGNSQGCNALAIMIQEGRGGPKAFKDAIPLFQRACDGGFLNGCSNLGLLYVRDEHDSAKAFPLLEKACANGGDEGSSSACGALASVLASGRAGTTDDARAAKLFEIACKAGHLFACTGLAGLLHEGRGVAKDDARAIPMYERACDGREWRACSELAAIRLAQDPDRAIALYQKACDADYADACIGLAHAIKDPAKSKQILDLWCAKGEMDACVKDDAGAPAAKPATRRPPPCKCNPGDPLCSCL
jgi:serine/threonine protein kinase/TPR repeat protein